MIIKHALLTEKASIQHVGDDIPFRDRHLVWLFVCVLLFIAFSLYCGIFVAYHFGHIISQVN